MIRGRRRGSCLMMMEREWRRRRGRRLSRRIVFLLILWKIQTLMPSFKRRKSPGGPRKQRKMPTKCLRPKRTSCCPPTPTLTSPSSPGSSPARTPSFAAKAMATTNNPSKKQSDSTTSKTMYSVLTTTTMAILVATTMADLPLRMAKGTSQRKEAKMMLTTIWTISTRSARSRRLILPMPRSRRRWMSAVSRRICGPSSKIRLRGWRPKLFRTRKRMQLLPITRKRNKRTRANSSMHPSRRPWRRWTWPKVRMMSLFPFTLSVACIWPMKRVWSSIPLAWKTL
mmetsp:Transcript_16140/g.29259  ORF Transcript_16140/g.29259 Transcript_16140/m.29259 type:complete len:283 (-) Transcript_16140:254-1102(-)